MAFFARISDPAIGGTYMTFLNTLTNLGNMWPGSFTLWFVDFLTWKVKRKKQVFKQKIQMEYALTWALSEGVHPWYGQGRRPRKSHRNFFLGV